MSCGFHTRVIALVIPMDTRPTTELPLIRRTLSLAVHEFRTPVTVVLGYLRMVLKEQAGPLSDKQRKMLEEADRACGRISGLVSEMGDLGRLESGELVLAKQEVDVNALVQELASDMHEGDDRDVRIDVHPADRPLIVTGDRTRLATAFRALLHAAVRERASGVVTADCSVADHGGAAWAVVVVSDASETAALRQIEQPQADFNEWRQGGLGLALPIARRVIEAHGGTIWSTADPQSRGASALRLPLRT